MAAVRDICRLGWHAYRGAPWPARLLMTARPLICPLDVAAEMVPEGARVLDGGCGAGLWLRWLARDRGIASGVGVDVSARTIAVAGGLTAVRAERVHRACYSHYLVVADRDTQKAPS